jgi:superfamily II DNA/RNA helicase
LGNLVPLFFLVPQIIVFMGTQDMVDYHCDLLTRIFAGAGGDDRGRQKKLAVDPGELEDDEGLLEGLELDSRPRDPVNAFIARLHGSLDQKDRIAIFTKFREAKTGILLCTVSMRLFVQDFNEENGSAKCIDYRCGNRRF